MNSGKISLLPGLERVLETVLSEYNSVLEDLKLPRVEIRESKVTVAETMRRLATQLPTMQAPSPPAEEKKKRTMSDEAKKLLSVAVKKRWAAAKRKGKSRL